MPTHSQIHILVDAGLKMHVKIDHEKTAMQKVYKFLHHFCKKGDAQPAYFSRVHIHIGDNYIKLEEGNAEKALKEARKTVFAQSDQQDFLSLWKTALIADGNDGSTFFIMSSVVEERVLDMFYNYNDKLLFLDFSGHKIKLNQRVKDHVQLIKHGEEVKIADKLHRKFLNEYITTVNFGLSMNSEFLPTTGIDKTPIDIENIKVVAATTSQPLETITVLARSFILPVDKCYDNKGTRVNSSLAYFLLKELLGEETGLCPNLNSANTSNLDQSLTAIKDESKDETKSDSNNDSKNDDNDGSLNGTKVGDKDTSKEDVEMADQTSELAVKGKTKSPRKRKPKIEALEEDDDDEEYTPTKKRGRKPTKSPGRGGKRTPIKLEKPVATPKRATRSSTRGRKAAKNEPKEEPEDEPVEQEQPTQDDKPLPNTKEPFTKTEESSTENGAETNGGEAKEPEKPADEPPPDPLFLVACATERFTGIRRPVILRLRGLHEDEKTYYDEETLKQKAEEAAAKKLEEEKEQLSAPTGVVMEEDSPASPPPFDCPASPDMAPIIPQEVKIIPTVPTIPLEPQDVDIRESQDVDYRRTPVKTIPLETTVKTPESDVDFRLLDQFKNNKSLSDKMAGGAQNAKNQSLDDGSAKATEPADPTVIRNGDLKKESCIIDDAVVPDEPKPEDLEPIKQQPVCIPVESEAEKTLKEVKQENEEEVADDSIRSSMVDTETMKLVEVIVLNTTWEQFKKEVAFEEDDEAFDELTEREQTVVGPEPFHDYTKLTGWYSGEAIQFYVNKMLRALRKLQERSAMFENEYLNMTKMVTFGQNPDLARHFAMLLRDESYGIPRDAVPFVESAAQYFDQLYQQLAYHPRFKRTNVPRRYQHHQPHHSQHYQLHPHMYPNSHLHSSSQSQHHQTHPHPNPRPHSHSHHQSNQHSYSHQQQHPHSQKHQYPYQQKQYR